MWSDSNQTIQSSPPEEFHLMTGLPRKLLIPVMGQFHFMTEPTKAAFPRENPQAGHFHYIDTAAQIISSGQDCLDDEGMEFRDDGLLLSIRSKSSSVKTIAVRVGGIPGSASSLSVSGVSAQGVTYQLPVEHVAKTPGSSRSYHTNRPAAAGFCATWDFPSA